MKKPNWFARTAKAAILALSAAVTGAAWADSESMPKVSVVVKDARGLAEMMADGGEVTEEAVAAVSKLMSNIGAPGSTFSMPFRATKNESGTVSLNNQSYTTSTDSAFVFTPVDDQTDEYGSWLCDFVVSFDEDVKADSVILAGYYSNMLVPILLGFDFEGNNVTKQFLLDSIPIQFDYNAIVHTVRAFVCTAINIAPENVGKTINVSLVMWNDSDSTYTKSNPYVVTTIPYKFTEENLSAIKIPVDGLGVVPFHRVSTGFDANSGLVCDGEGFVRQQTPGSHFSPAFTTVEVSDADADTGAVEATVQITVEPTNSETPLPITVSANVKIDAETVSAAVDADTPIAANTVVKVDAVVQKAATMLVGSAPTSNSIEIKVRSEEQSPVQQTIVYQVDPIAIVNGDKDHPIVLSNEDLAADAVFTFELDVSSLNGVNVGDQVKVTHSWDAYTDASGNAVAAGSETTLGTVSAGQKVQVTTTHFSTWTLEGITIEEDSVAIAFAADGAVIGQFTTLTDAISAATSGGTVVLLKNTTATTIPDGKNITLDLNGKTITGQIYVNANATLVVNATNGGVIDNSAKADSYVAYAINAAGNLTINGGTFKGGAKAAAVSVGGDSSTVTVNDGTFSGLYGLYVGEKVSSVRINDGTFTGSAAVEVATPSGATADGGVQIDIYGGSFTRTDSSYEVIGFNLNSSSSMLGTPKVTLYGGTYNKFQKRSSLATGYQQINNGDGTWTVKESLTEAEKALAVAKVGDYYFFTASDANEVGGLKSGETIELTRDSSDFALTLPDGATLEGNGHTLTGVTYVSVPSPRTGTIKNVKFKEATGTTSHAIIGAGGTLVVTGCEFDSCRPDNNTIEYNGSGDGSVTITGNVFTHSNPDKTPERYINVYGRKGADVNFTATIKDNIIKNANDGGTTIVPIRLKYFGATETLDIGGNYIEDPTAIAINESTNLAAFNFAIYESLDGDGKIDANSSVMYKASGEADPKQISKVSYVAQIGTTKYETLAAAVAEATEGQTITLLADATDSLVTIPSTVTLNAGGFDYTAYIGAGTSADPYQISNLSTLKAFRDYVDLQLSDGTSQYAGKYFKLTTDIDLANEIWEPIGSMNGDHGSFKGVFDGDGHTISNLNVQKGERGLGFFSYTSENAEIKNLTFANVTVKSTAPTAHGTGSYVGGVVGDGYASTKISNVHLTGTIDIEGFGYVGGIVGHGYVKVSNSSVECEGTISGNMWCVGGIVGYAGEGATAVTDTNVTGSDTGLTIQSAAGGVGAIVGKAEDNGGIQPISGSNLSATNVTVKTFVGMYGTGYATYALGYLYGGNSDQYLSGDLTVNNVTFDAQGNANPPVQDAVATVDDTIYFVLSSAVDAAQSGDIVTVTRNLKLRESISIDSDVTIDLAGKTIALADGVESAFVISGDTTLTVNNGTAVVAIEGYDSNYRVMSETDGAATIYSAVPCAAEIAGTPYRTFADAIAVANSQNIDEITILDGTSESPDAAWKVSDGKLVRKVYVAQIGTTKFETLAAAVEAVPENGAEATTIKMIADEELGNAYVEIPAGKNIILDLNGKTVTSTHSGDGAIYNKGTLTIMGNGTINGNVAAFENEGTLTVENGAYSGINCVYNSGEQSEVVINGGSYNTNGTKGYALYSSGGKVTITGGDFYGWTFDTYSSSVWTSKYAVQCGDTEVSISGGTFTGIQGALECDGCQKVDITGGTFTTRIPTAEESAVDYSGARVNYAILIWDNNKPAEVNISNGTFISNSEWGKGVMLLALANAGTTVNISGGTFTQNVAGTASAIFYNDLVNGTLRITGGTFVQNDSTKPIAYMGPELLNGSISGGWFTSVVPEAYCAADYSPTTTADANGMYTVVSDYEAQIVRGGAVVTPKGTLADMVVATQDGDTVTLLKDVTTSEIVYVDKSITLDGDGHKLITSAARGIRVRTANVDVTIKNLEIPYNSNVERGIQIDSGREDVLLTLENVKAAGREMGLLVLTGSDRARLLLKNVELTAKYAAYISMLDDATLTIQNSQLEGYSALNLYGDNGTVTIEDSTLVGVNNATYDAEGWNDFGVIVVAGDTTGKTQECGSFYNITVKNTAIVVDSTNGNGQRAILYNIPCANNAITLENCTVEFKNENCTFLCDNGADSVTKLKGTTVYGTENIPDLPEGYCYVDDGDYKLVSKAVAQIGNTGYASLADALAAAQDGDTVQLLADVSLTERLFVNAGAEPAYAGSNNRYATTSENKGITLDLNGKNITSASNIALAGGSLNITGTGTISTTGSGLAPIEVRGTGDLANKRTLTIGAGVTLHGDYGLNVFGSNDAQKNIIDVTVNGTVNGTLFVLGNLTNAENEIDIVVNGTVIAPNGTGTDVNVGIALNGNANVTVNNGATVSGDSGIEVRAGNLTVNGGTISATSQEYSYKPNGSGSTTKGAAIAVAQHGTLLQTTATLNGGTLSGTKQIAVTDVNGNMDAVTVKATQGYTQSSAIPEGYKWVETEPAGVYTLAPKTYVAQIVRDDKVVGKYETLQAAVDAAANGDTVQLLSDIALTSKVTIDKSVKIDGNDKTITVTKGDANNYAFYFIAETVAIDCEFKNATIVSTGYQVAIMGNCDYQSTLKVDNVDITCDGECIYANGFITVNATGCEFRHNGMYATGKDPVYYSAIIVGYSGTINLADCAIVSFGNGVSTFPSGGTITLTDVDIAISEESVSEQNAGYALFAWNGDYTTHPEYCKDSVITFNSGKVKGGFKIVDQYPRGDAKNKYDAVIHVNGGIFSESPANINGVVIKTGYEVVDNTDAETKEAYPYMVDRKLEVIAAADGTVKLSKVVDSGYTFQKQVGNGEWKSVAEMQVVESESELPASGATQTYKFKFVDGATDIPVGNTVGILHVADSQANKTTIIGVPWFALGEKITVDSLVYLGNREAGDQLMAYDAANGTYYSWTLEENDKTKVLVWTADTTMKTGSKEADEAPAASEFEISRGQGVFLKRKDPFKPIYLVGRAPASGETGATTTLAAGSASKPTWSLVAAPSTAPLDLNASGSRFGAENADDTIMLVSAGGVAMKIPYTYKNGKWGRLVSKTVTEERANKTVTYTYTERSTEGCTIPAGTGFWYLNKGGEKTVEW